jgi:hypothetical protein
VLRRILIVMAAVAAAHAQDLRTVSSPDGRLEFHLFVGQPPDSGLSRLGYQVSFDGRRVIDTSWLGVDILTQEPILGQYVGLTTSVAEKHDGYNQLIAHYMQNGSLGRLLDFEVRVSDREIRFRYFIPRSTPLAEPFTIDDEKTEFAVEESAGALTRIGEENPGPYPKMTLVKSAEGVLVTRLERTFDAKAPLTTPWRTIRLTSP